MWRGFEGDILLYMPRTLHVLRRTEQHRPDPLTFDLLREGRVLELYDAPIHASVADLTLAERDLPELAAELHRVEHVVAHQVHPVVVLQALPIVRPDVLKQALLTLRGPWPALREGARKRDGYLSKWPGPIEYDGLGSRDDVEACASRPVSMVEPYVDALDPHRLDLVRRSCGPIAVDLGDGRRVVNVMLSVELDDVTRYGLGLAIPSTSRPDVVVQTIDESAMPRYEWPSIRRASQVYVTANWKARANAEAVRQGIPLILVADDVAATKEQMPMHGVVVGGTDVVDRVVACIRSWTQYWAEGVEVPVKTGYRETLRHSQYDVGHR